MNIDEDKLKRIVEALLFATDEPLSIKKVGALLTKNEKEVEAAILKLKEEYTKEARSFKIRKIAGGYQICTLPEFAPWIEKFYSAQNKVKLSPASLETLAIVAYKQPIIRADIESIRGVEVSGVLHTLLKKGLLRIRGRKKGLGRPILYGTTPQFLKYFGLQDLSELPNLEELKELVGEENESGKIEESD